jgi:hypothetical protein
VDIELFYARSTDTETSLRGDESVTAAIERAVVVAVEAKRRMG